MDKKDKTGRMGKVRTISLPPEVLEETPEKLLVDPPKFPLLVGQEESQIVRRVMELTKDDKLQWRHNEKDDYPSVNYYDVDYYAADFLGLKFQIVVFSLPWLKLSIKSNDETSEFENRLSGTDLEELFLEIKNQISRRTTRETAYLPECHIKRVDPHLQHIWEVLTK